MQDRLERLIEKRLRSIKMLYNSGVEFLYITEKSTEQQTSTLLWARGKNYLELIELIGIPGEEGLKYKWTRKARELKS